MSVLAVMTSYVNARYGTLPDSVMGAPEFDTTNGGTGTSNEYDNTYVRGSIHGVNTKTQPILDLGANYSEFWLHYEVYNQGTVNSARPSVEFLSAAFQRQYTLLGVSGGATYHFYRSTANVSYDTRIGTGQITYTSSRKYAMDIHVKNHGSTGIFDVYVDGVLVSSFSGNTSTNGDSAVRYIRFRSATNNNTLQFSQVVAATVPTVGWKVQELPPLTGTQEFTGWTGTFSDCDDAGYTAAKADSIFANADSTTESFVVADVVAAASSMIVQAVAVSARVLATPDTAVETFVPGLSISSTFYEGGDYSVDPLDGEKVIQKIWDAHPNTGSGWTQSDVNALQIGVRAKT